MKYILSIAGQESRPLAAFEILDLFDSKRIDGNAGIRIEGSTDENIPLVSSNLFKQFDHMRTLPAEQRASFIPDTTPASSRNTTKYSGSDSSTALRVLCLLNLVSGIVLGGVLSSNSRQDDVNVAFGIALILASLLSVAFMFSVASMAENLAIIRKRLEQK